MKRPESRLTVRSMRYLSIALLIGLCLLRDGAATAAELAGPDPAGVKFVLDPVDAGEVDYLETTVGPGTDVTLEYFVGSAGPDPVSALLYPADVYTLVNGGLGVELENEPIAEPTTWLDLQPERMELDPGHVERRTLTIRVPDGVQPGQHITSLVVQTAAPLAVPGHLALTQTLRRTMAVVIEVPGPVEPELAIGEASYVPGEPGGTLQVAIRNPGNVLLKPAGTLALVREGETVLEAPVEMGSVYAWNETSIEIPLARPLETGEYMVSLSLSDEATGVEARVDDLVLNVTDVEASPAPVTIASFTINEAKDPASDALQYVEPVIEIANTGPAVENCRITLTVVLDGKTVESYPIVPGMQIPTGTTEVRQRYLPLDGWRPGSYDFSLTIETVDGSGAATVIATAEAAESIEVN